MKILYVTTIGSTMGFFKSFINQLIDEGHTIDIATNEDGSNVPACYREWGCTIHQIDTSRSPLKKGNIKAIKQLKMLVEREQYDIVHCHTPVAAMCTRLACRGVRKKGTKVIYTAHGFHFYKGAPLKNWLIYYPVEKFCSHFTDVLITINNEDYELASEKLKAKKVVYVPGVGIDLEKFSKCTVDINEKRKELGIPENAFVLLSVGELNQNKNHEVIIKAISKSSFNSIHYVVAGIGAKKYYLEQLSMQLNVNDRIHLIGYRSDVNELYKMADVCVFPSIREGLGMCAIEGMASGLPLIVSDNRGTRSYCKNNRNGYVLNAKDVEGFCYAIENLFINKDIRFKMGKINQEEVKKYSILNIQKSMQIIYEDEIGDSL